MMTEHTAGSWVAEFHQERESDPGWWSIEAEILRASGSVMDSFNRHHSVAPEEDRANAHLIAAAPDLLAAGEFLLALIDSVGDELPGGQSDRVFAQFEFDSMRAAIAKARGVTRGTS